MSKESRLLTPDENKQIFFECGQLYRPSLSYLVERLNQDQDTKSVKAIIADLDLLVKTGHLNRLTFDEFLQALKRGIDEQT